MKIDIDKFIEENRKAIFLEGIPQYRKKPKVLAELITNAETCVDYDIKTNDVLGEIWGDNLKEMVSALSRFTVFLAEITQYVPFSTYRETLMDVISSMHVSFITSNISTVYIVFPSKIDTEYKNVLTKSNFWVYLLTHETFRGMEGIELKYIYSSDVRPDDGKIYVYPDDTIYSGSQFLNAFDNLIENFVIKQVDPPRSYLLPMVGYLGDILPSAIENETQNEQWAENSRLLLSQYSKQISSLGKSPEYQMLYSTCDEFLREVGHYLSLYSIQPDRSEELIDRAKAKINKVALLDYYDKSGLEEHKIASETLDWHSYTTYDIYNYFVTNQIMDKIANYLQDPAHVKVNDIYDDIATSIIFRTSGGKHVSLSMLQMFQNNPDILRDLITIEDTYLYLPIYTAIPVYFQHKLADPVSVPNIFYSTCASLVYNKETGVLEQKLVGNLFQNCEKTVENKEHYFECPPAAYKNIKYTYNGEPISLDEMSLSDFFDMT